MATPFHDLWPRQTARYPAFSIALYPIPEIVTPGDSQISAALIQDGERRRFAMAILLRGDFDASRLRSLAKKAKDGPQARRLLALAAIYDGAMRTEAAKIGGVGLQIIRDWVIRFNASGPVGLLNGKAPGQPSKLNDAQRQVIAQMIESGPIPAVHGVVRWRLIDLAQWIFEEFRITIAKQTLSRELRTMGYRKLSARPRHHAQAEGVIEDFKKDSRRAWMRSRVKRPSLSRQ
jgi:transposase